ncbi:aconitate hydratase AcnA [Vibrio sp. ABG19]|uniref:aconitate hydratase AcnA n=1 Tax=Vibrio sp. ABG19 TaxID=2817385 RepID=UPI00249E5FEE|nr:aconitate hydratase AcnA [Vibrio sp. ABG19]WGY46855.1 aconitate hydratase AcnA [Vibrio sp. ABG19]
MTKASVINDFPWENKSYKYVDLPSLCGQQLSAFPYVLRLLLENAVRNHSGDERSALIDTIFDWLPATSSDKEIPYYPRRVLMHDTTSTPALVDMAALRDCLAEQGIDPKKLNPSLQVDISVDHSLAVEYYADPNAAPKNLALEMQRNEERYRFLRWASKAFHNVRINPPGTGIMHTINLEQLASVVTTYQSGPEHWLAPDMMLGTDSHTPMVNGIGVLGWGVGGLEAQSAMFGIPTMLRIPDIVGVKLVGELTGTAQATDLALVVTQRLRSLGVTGDCVEFFGPGVSSLSADDRCVIANMAPEYGATTGYFAVDSQTLDYLRRTGRTAQHISLVEHYCKHNGLWFEPDQTPEYSRAIVIDLGQISTQVAGPKRPQDLLDYQHIPASLNLQCIKRTASGELPSYPVAIAAITSCTNTTHPALLIAAGLLARKANRYGMTIPDWVKTSLAPGSPAAAKYLQRAGLLDELSLLGFDIVGYGCSTCIGNSGQLPEKIQQAQARGEITPVAAISGNRNFPGRIHPDLELGYLMSPALVVAFAIAGDAHINLESQPLHITAQGEAIFLRDIWPSRQEISDSVNFAMDANDFKSEFKKASHQPGWDKLSVTDSPLFAWDSYSTTIRRPPFVDKDAPSSLGSYSAYPLMILGDDVTTDHISPASAIPQQSYIADFLVLRGEDRSDLNVFSSRRGNWEVMMRAAFYNKSLLNQLTDDLPVGHTLHIPSGEVAPIWQVANKYRANSQPTVIIAGERYGMGSSRDWAAKGQKLLNVHAVLALSFERIHRSNLIGMGILPLVLSPAQLADLNLQHGDQIEICAEPQHIQPQAQVTVAVRRAKPDEERVTFSVSAAIETRLEADLLRQGGVFRHILSQYACDKHADSMIS